MAVTTHRPAPLPTAQFSQQAQKKLPDGAVRMSKTWLDAKGLPRSTPYPVPVDADERRTPHLRFRCPRQVNANGGGKQPCPRAEWLLPGTVRFCPEHGEQLTVPPEGSRLGAVVADAYCMYGRHAAAWALPAAALLADVGMSLAEVGAMDVLPAAPVLAGGAWYATKRTLTRRAITRRRIEKGQRDGRRMLAIRMRARQAAFVGAEAGLWATVLSGTDLTSRLGVVVAAAAAVRWAVGVKPWWDRAEARRLRDLLPDVQTPAAVDAQPVAAPDPVQLRAITTWKTLIGCKGGPLADTELVEYQRLPACDVLAHSRTRLPNWSAKVVPLVPGSINMRESRPTLLGRIAAAYGCTYADVSFSADETDLGVGWLRAQPDNLLAETKLWPGPDVACDWKRGQSKIGRFDDARRIVYAWWTKIGAAHDLISGCSGSGKSELVAQLILAGLHSDGLVLDWLADPQGGQSYGALKDAVDWFARDVSEIRLMLLAALKEMQRRNDELSANNIKTWRPSKAMPLLVITLDEVQSYIDDPIILEMVEKLVGQARKCGIKMRLVTQVPAAYNLGGSTYIKEQLKTGQTLIFRAMTDIAGRSATDGDCPIDPTELPTVWGKHTCAAGETTAGLLFAQGLCGRDVYGRADWTGEDMLRWLVDQDGVPTVSAGVFSRAAQEHSGVLWGDRKERARRLLEAGRSDADLLQGGKAIELIQAAAVTSPGPAAAGQPTSPAPAPERSREVLLSLIRETADTHGMVDRATVVKVAKGRMADGTRDKALTDLVADGSLRRVKNGLYEVSR